MFSHSSQKDTKQGCPGFILPADRKVVSQPNLALTLKHVYSLLVRLSAKDQCVKSYITVLQALWYSLTSVTGDLFVAMAMVLSLCLGLGMCC